ncbi:MAG: hypothetical protein LBH79_03255 [Nitrososphaerota archaeon]|nr:hypothetical protein [Nitrososphaerota archaeon]
MFEKLKKMFSGLFSFGWREDTDIATMWQFEIVRNGVTVAKTKPTHNVTTDAGRNAARAILHQASHGSITGFDMLSVGSVDYTPGAGETTLSGEVNDDGLERVAGSYTNDVNTGEWKLENTFTYTGANPVTVYTGALFNASTAGTMLYAAKFSSSAVLANGDQLKVTVSGSIGAA